LKSGYGIDGCRGGWVVASYDLMTVQIIQQIDKILEFARGSVFLIDIPVGLPSRAQPVRTCETQARRLLPAKRKSSVFGVPCREALRARTYERANALNREVLGKGLSLQSWFICPKIREVDTFLVEQKTFGSRVRECHPELAFQFLNRGLPLQHGKKSAEGRQERLRILQSLDSRSEELFATPLQHASAHASKDDVLDALCLALTQSLRLRAGLKKSIHCLVSKPRRDAKGLEMSIAYFERETNPDLPSRSE
jgi:predicted RNase H-like nuclease